MACKKARLSQQRGVLFCEYIAVVLSDYYRRDVVFWFSGSRAGSGCWGAFSALGAGAVSAFAWAGALVGSSGRAGGVWPGCSSVFSFSVGAGGGGTSSTRMVKP